MYFIIEDRHVRDLELQLSEIRDKSVPFATRETLNNLAFEARDHARRFVSREMVERNSYTRRSYRAERATGLRIFQQQSVVGNSALYMDRQELGGVRDGGRYGVLIATPDAAKQEGASGRTRLVSRPYRMRNMRLLAREHTRRGRNPKQRLVMAVNMAVKRSERNVFLDRRKHSVRTGIYRVIGGRYRGRGWPIGARLRMLYDMSHRSVRVPPHSTLQPSVNLAQFKVGMFYEKALRFQLGRLEKLR